MQDELNQPPSDDTSVASEGQEPETPAVEPSDPTPEAEPHPLEPGGKRFAEVYREMKEAKERLAYLEGRESARQTTPPPQPQQPQQNFWTHQQLQAAVDAGKLTPMQASAQLAWQERQIAKQEIKQELSHERKLTGAEAEVKQYLSNVPALRQPSSPEFNKVKEAAWEIADELGLPVEDVRVQRRALREALGSLDKITKVQQNREFDRTRRDTHSETSSGGGVQTPTPSPLKGVPQMYLDHWKRLGYDQKRMVEEAKYVKKRV